MRVLVIGSGAREHAIVWKLAQSPRIEKLFAAPGNPGMSEEAERVSIGVSQLNDLADFAQQQQIDLTVVGPEVPLVEGIADEFRKRGLRIFGPDKAGAKLEGSKAFTKELLTEANIPTAQSRTFYAYNDALAYLEEHGAPVVVKADGNAAGKGAVVAHSMELAREALRQMMVDRLFGAAGDIVVIEDYLQGNEIGFTAICHGTQYLALTTTQDHKRALDNDEGLNTGGMGAFTPLPFLTPQQEEQIQQQIITPTLEAMKRRNIDFTGVLYSNIMLTDQGPKVLEHNTRFGDPETQALMMLLNIDLLDVLEYAETGQTPSGNLWKPGYAVSITLASGGYPGEYQSGYHIHGIEQANQIEGVKVFHAGTAQKEDQLVTAGGRVLSVAAYANTLEEAVKRAYQGVDRISFEGKSYRHDIAHRGLKALRY